MSPAATSIGVLLPMRLETRFVEPDAAGGTWTLLVRVVPDAVSFDRHQPLATHAELDAVEAMWRASAGDVSTEEGATAWRVLAARTGPARGMWLARTFPAVPQNGSFGIIRPAEVREGLEVGQVAGLPDVLELWLGRAGAAPELAAQLTVDPGLLTLSFPDPDSGETRWWTSFDEAVRSGLGARIDLGPARPDDIDVLYLVGLGDGDPAALFAAHRDAGVLGILRMGTPTNSVDGEPAADLARDPETWRQLFLGRTEQRSSRLLDLALTGSSGALLPLPGAGTDHTVLDRALVMALWPALWGHALKDVWDLGDDAFDLGRWARDNLAPRGPVASLRIGDQPYGVLPVTALHGWVPGAGDPPVEARLAAVALRLRAAWARAAEGVGTTTGATTQQLLDRLSATPSSDRYAWRWQLPLEVIQTLSAAFGSGLSWLQLTDWWNETARDVLDGGTRPTRSYATLGWPVDLAIPLVEADNTGMSLDDALTRLLAWPPHQLAGGRRELFDPWPDSLLLRLLVHALLVNAAEVVRASQRERGPFLEPITAPENQATALAVRAERFAEDLLRGDAAHEQWEASYKGTSLLVGEPPTEIEHAFRFALDTAGHRVDPWVTGIAWRRLTELAGTARFRLGAYGWVDAPRPRAPGGPPQEFLHAPSEPQAVTSAVLRDRALFDAEPARWDIDIGSGAARLAEQLADEVRLGSHLSEVLGRAVERALGSRPDVDRLRRLCPIRTEHAGRRVCDGLRVLERLRADPAGLSLSQPQLDALAPLAQVVDTYGDLLVAGGVHDVVSGRTAVAGAAMEAAAGLDAPPTLDVLRTPRSGRTVATTVVITLPDAPPPDVVDAHTSPGTLAEPAGAAFLAGVFPADGPDWTWQVLDEAGAPIDEVTLAELGLAPVDTLSLTAADLVTAVLELSGGARVEPPPDRELEAHTWCRRSTDALGSRPVVPGDLIVDGVAADAVPPDDAVHADLLARYEAVHGVGTALVAALLGAGDAAQRRAALTAALRWGITPLLADEPSLETQVARSASALADRLARAPSATEAAAGSVELLARALAELVSPEGRLPVLSRMLRGSLPVTLQPEPPAEGTALDPDWLEVVAAVRPPLARLEAHQLERAITGNAGFSGWSSRSGDPWQLSVDAAEPSGLGPSTRLHAVFGPAGTLDGAPGQPVALGLLDSWSEVVPATEHSTTVAFHFDAPGARAQQAILVAVPPDPSTPLDTTSLIDILGETRELTRARAAGPGNVDAFAAGLPLTLFPAGGSTGVELDPT